MLEVLTLGQKADDEEFETLMVFGLMAFGADALQWDERVFMYRTGIALKLWEKGVGRARLI